MNTDTNPNSPDGKQSVITRNVTLEFITAVVIFAGLIGFITYQNRVRYEERAEFSARSLAHSLAEEVDDAINQINLGILTVAHETEQQVAEGKDMRTLNALIASQKQQIPFLDTLRFVNQTGENMIGTDISPGLVTSVADRSFFTKLHNDPTAGLLISEPMQGQVDNDWAIILARRINKPDGSFAGLVSGAISLNHLHQLLVPLQIGNHGSVAVYDDKQTLIDCYPRPKGFGSLIGTQDSFPEVRKGLGGMQQEGVFHSSDNLDRVNRIYAYRQVKNRPLYVSVGLAEEDFLAGWKRECIWSLALTGFFVLCTFAFFRFVYRQMQK